MNIAMDGRVVFRDQICGEPIAWFRAGDRVVGSAARYDDLGRYAGKAEYTRVLTARDAAQKYGAVTEVVVGLLGGFESATYGCRRFASNLYWYDEEGLQRARPLDPRPFDDLMDGVTVTVDDPVTDNYPCLKCDAVAGQHCTNVATRHRARERFASEQLGLA